MRMRRKKNLEEKLLSFSNELLSLKSDDKNFSNADKYQDYIDTEELFGNTNPVHLEIGCGKGQFAVEIAKRNQNINYLAVEKYANVLVDACDKLKESGLKNLKFVRCSAEYLPTFIKPDSIGRIYLNFSCPFPKKAYANHRLTAQRFLKIYDRILQKGAEIHQKTDNMHFFEFSINNLSEYGFTIKNISLDLHNSDFEGNIVTEYEKRFSDMGMPIYRLEAYIK